MRPIREEIESGSHQHRMRKQQNLGLNEEHQNQLSFGNQVQYLEPSAQLGQEEDTFGKENDKLMRSSWGLHMKKTRSLRDMIQVLIDHEYTEFDLQENLI